MVSCQIPENTYISKIDVKAHRAHDHELKSLSFLGENN